MTSNKQVAIAQALLQINAVGFSPEKPITFKSGLRSPVYVDNRRLPFHPTEWQTVLHGFRALVEEKSLNFDAIAGIAVGGVPHSSALGYILNKPSLFIRKESKGYGHQKLIEGGVRAEGAIVTDLVAIVTYGFEEAKKTFAEANVTLHTLVPFSTILAEALTLGRFDKTQAAVIDDWFAAPQGWAERHHL
jgi:orotate phosphoribosyltransferase